jgi:hypothetical protein
MNKHSRDFTITYLGSILGECDTTGSDCCPCWSGEGDYSVCITDLGTVFIAVDNLKAKHLFPIIGYCEFHKVPYHTDSWWHGLASWFEEFPEAFGKNHTITDL